LIRRGICISEPLRPFEEAEPLNAPKRKRRRRHKKTTKLPTVGQIVTSSVMMTTGYYTGNATTIGWYHTSTAGSTLQMPTYRVPTYYEEP